MGNYCSKEKHVFVLRVAFLEDLHKALVVIPDNKLTWDHDTVSSLPEAQPSRYWPRVRGKPIMKWEGRGGRARGSETNWPG